MILFTLKNENKMGFFNSENEKEGGMATEGGHSPVNNLEKADVVIHIVDDTQLEKAAVFLRYSDAQERTASAFTSAVRCTGSCPALCGHWAGNGSTIGGYIENVLEEHLQTYGDDINALLRRETSQLALTMAELLIVLMMAFNLWMVIYLTWERREENVPKEDKEKDDGRTGKVRRHHGGKACSGMPERKPQAAAPMSNATVQAPGEEVDEKDVAF